MLDGTSAQRGWTPLAILLCPIGKHPATFRPVYDSRNEGQKSFIAEAKVQKSHVSALADNLTQPRVTQERSLSWKIAQVTLAGSHVYGDPVSIVD